MVHEIVLAIDPFLSRLEQILLWKSKLKSCIAFTLCHVLFWLFLNYNIRTYCTISCIFLVFHLLDAYRTKKRRELIKLHQSNKNIGENEPSPGSPKTQSNPFNNLSSLGRFIVYFNSKLVVIYANLNKLKRRNRFIYFMVMFIFWSGTAIIGSKIQGLYLTYIFFWIIFFVPPIIHYDIPKKVLSRALPLLEQLDHSMKYERRSVLDKSELLVNVKHKTSEQDDEAEEDEYLKSFQLNEKLKNRAYEDTESLFSEQTDEDEDGRTEEDTEEDEEEVIEEVYEIQTYNSNSDKNNRNNQDNEQVHVTKLVSKRSNRLQAPVKTSAIQLDVFDVNNDSLLPDEFMPNVNMSALSNSLLHTSNDESFSYNTRSKVKNIDSGNKVLKTKRVKNRPNVLDYYGEPKINSTKTPQNECDIDETFDFLDEELEKY